MTKNRAFEYRHRYAPIWSLLTSEERQQVIFERAAHFRMFRETKLFLAGGNYGTESEIELEPEPEEDDNNAQPFDEQSIAVQLPPEFAVNINTANVYRLLLEGKDTLSSLASKLNLPDKTVGGVLKRLRKAGIVRVAGERRHEPKNRPGFVYEIMRIAPEYEPL